MSKIGKVFGGGGGSQPVDNSAEIARQQEEDKRKRIQEGVGAIDNAFTGYNDDFYNNYQNTYTSYYQPQLDDQYKDAQRRLTLNLARSGNLTSSAGSRQMADLESLFKQQYDKVTNDAMSAGQNLRQQIANQKSQLYADNQLSADPSAATSAAVSAAQALQPTAPASPLANAFTDFFNNLGNAAAVSNRVAPYGQADGVQSFSGSNGVRVIGSA